MRLNGKKLMVSKKQYRLLLLLVVVMLITAGVWYFGSWKAAARYKQATISVTATVVKQQAMPIMITTSGVIVPAHTVALKSQVTGVVKKVYFKSGNLVVPGQLLFELDPANFIAQVKQAEANLAQDKALLVSLKSDVERYADLVKKAYISKQQYEQAVANYNAQLAKTKTDEQDIKQAKISLSYTKIKAPIGGKTGNVSLKVGDSVKANSDIPMVVINEINPIEAQFNIAQHEFAKLRHYHRLNPIIVDVWNERVSKKLASGTLNFIDNQINTETGNILLKTDIDNKNHALWPGEFVTIKLILTTQQDALTIPANAVHTDQQGHFVYLVKNNHAVVTRVSIDRQIDNQAVVASGLTVNDSVIILSQPNIKNNALVKVENLS
jgi:multidrug efflux system membrane fusion protein